MTYVRSSDQPVGSTLTLLAEETGEVVQRTVLPGGLRILTESIPGVHSVVFGVWVAAGSRHETKAQHGAAHYLEHLLFKATRKRTALDVASEIEAVGGELNAFTSREYTCFYARVLDRDLPLAADVVLDVVGGGLMRDVDVESERDVVLEEIAMHEDDPADVVHEQFITAVCSNPSLARPVLGSAQSIASLTPRAIRSFYRRHYRPESMIISVAGNVDHETVVATVSELVRPYGWLAGSAAAVGAPAGTPARRKSLRDLVIVRPTEQTHLILGGKGITRTDPARYDLAVLNAALGGGMSSRLFSEVREERGLAYSVYSFTSPFVDDGCFGVYVGTKPGKAVEALGVIRGEISAVAGQGLTDDEVARSKGQVRGTMVLGLEDPFARMARLGKSEFLSGELPGIDELHRRVDGVTPASVRAVAKRVLAAPMLTTIVGPAPKERTA